MIDRELDGQMFTRFRRPWSIGKQISLKIGHIKIILLIELQFGIDIVQDMQVLVIL